MKLANELARRRIKQVHFVGIGGAGCRHSIITITIVYYYY